MELGNLQKPSQTKQKTTVHIYSLFTLGTNLGVGSFWYYFNLTDEEF